ncbi:FkbM family methyltransferase [cf. Phormidesmis sp. LEGE 11477]|uniref:FkbM family methyltransferase n=1 Tax=cf. Phormidesmis sp. LEGE 11477 TaxID=1828680 RepID=UPI00187F00EF|nr:FkbM family methyltransferase [cf. Phormidesmis sp. LEGE 11477]MBE9061357.1 FkbM family methyltransferase [cf. Phormidesmis sp. LEGE 11477]
MKRTIKDFVLRFPRLRTLLSDFGLEVPLPIWDKKPDRNNGYYSQYGQDHWIVERVFPDRLEPGFFIEMGAGDGLLLSNTAILEKKFNWTGLLIEPSHQFEKLEENRNSACINACISNKKGYIYIAEMPAPSCMKVDPNNALRSMTIDATDVYDAKSKALSRLPHNFKDRITQDMIAVREVKCTTMKDVLLECGAPKTIDYMSLDVEGHEYEIMSNFPFEEYKVLAMNIERPNKELRSLLGEKGYFSVARNQCGDLFYIHESMSGRYYSN